VSVSWVPHTISVTVSVYERNGLKRGPGILSAAFRTAPPRWVPDESRFNVTGGGPLGTPLYQVQITFMRRVDDPDPRFNLEVWAGKHYPADYWVRNGQVFEARLDRAP
jgi:hypothetical protein